MGSLATPTMPSACSAKSLSTICFLASCLAGRCGLAAATARLAACHPNCGLDPRKLVGGRAQTYSHTRLRFHGALDVEDNFR
jgi:hypothetical protein